MLCVEKKADTSFVPKNAKMNTTDDFGVQYEIRQLSTLSKSILHECPSRTTTKKTYNGLSPIGEMKYDKNRRFRKI